MTQFVTFSEEVVPGDGNPYREILDSMQANPSADARTVAAIFVDRFHSSYAIGDRGWSTTKSAYDLSGLTAFHNALSSLAVTLRGNLGTLRADIQLASANSQKFTYSQLTDIVDFLDQINLLTSDPARKTPRVADLECWNLSDYVSNRALLSADMLTQEPKRPTG